MHLEEETLQEDIYNYDTKVETMWFTAPIILLH